jgi:hypothetical protein
MISEESCHSKSRNTALTGRAFPTVFPKGWHAQLTSGRKEKRSGIKTLILMAIIESYVWVVTYVVGRTFALTHG